MHSILSEALDSTCGQQKHGNSISSTHFTFDSDFFDETQCICLSSSLLPQDASLQLVDLDIHHVLVDNVAVHHVLVDLAVHHVLVDSAVHHLVDSAVHHVLVDSDVHSALVDLTVHHVENADERG